MFKSINCDFMVGRALQRKNIKPKEKPKVKGIKKPTALRTQKFLEYANTLETIVRGVVPEGLELSQKDITKRRNIAKQFLEIKLSEIKSSKIPQEEKDYIIPRYENWINIYKTKKGEK